MEANNTNTRNEQNTWDEYWQSRLAEYYATARYTGD